MFHLGNGVLPLQGWLMLLRGEMNEHSPTLPTSKKSWRKRVTGSDGGA